jgi:hypothetical protein
MAISLDEGGSNLETFSTQLNGAVATLDAAGYGHELESSVALEGLVSKLPTHLLARWGRNVTRLFPRVPTLRDLNAWLGFELMGMKNVQGVIPQTKPATPTIAPPQHSTRQRHQENGVGWTRNSNQSFYRAATTVKTTQPTVNAIAAKQEVLSRCIVCNEEPGHALEHCTQFLGMSVDDKAKAVYDLDNCFRCLGRNHLCRECKKALRCEICNSASHHTLIHGASRAAPGQQSRPSERGRLRPSSK